jgi:stress response protein YsnF
MRYEGDTLIIPVIEEVLVVEKKLLLKEEVHITKYVGETQQEKTVTLRSEEVSVERTEEQTEG